MVNSRDTGALYTGISSVSFQKAQEKKKLAESSKIARQAELKPFAEDIIKEVDVLRGEIAKELGNIIHIEMKPEDIKSTVLGLRLADAKLVSFRVRINNIMRRQVKDIFNDR